jgi:CHAT domain-containing protein
MSGRQKDLSASSLLEIVKIQIRDAKARQPVGIWSTAINALKSRPTPDTVTLAYAINSLGEFYAKHDEANLAIPCFLEVISLFPSTSMEEELGFSNGNLGNLLNKQSDPGSSLPYLGRALKIFSHHYGNENLYVSVILNTMGMTHGKIGRTQKQLEYLLQCKKIRENKLDPCHHMMFEVYNNLALTYSKLGDHHLAEKYMTSVLDCAKKATPQNKSQLVHILTELTGIKSHNNQTYTANEIDGFFTYAIQESELILAAHHPKLKNIYNNYAVRLLDQSKYARALPFFQKALLSAYRPLSNVGTTDFFLPSFDSMHDPGVDDATLISNLGAMLHAVYEQEKDRPSLDQAYQAFLLADSIMMTLKSTIIHGTSRESIKYTSRRIYTLASTNAACLYSITLNPVYLETLFQYIEKIKNWELLERFSYSSRSQNLSNSELAKKIDSLKNQLSFSSSKFVFDSLETVQNNLLQQLKVDHPFYYQQLYGSSSVSLITHQDYCKNKNENWLIYFNVSGGSTGIILVSPDTLVLHLGKNNYANIVQYKSQLLEFIENKNWDFVSPAHQLYRELIKPVKSFINEKKLVVTGLTSIMGIPFDVLLQEDVAPLDVDTSSLILPYLLYDQTISYMHSAGFALAIEHISAHVRSPVFIAPQYNGDQLQLAWNQEEVSHGQEHIGGHMFLGPEASEQQFQSTLINHDMIHFAGHVYAEEQVDQTFLLMHHSLDSLFLQEIVSSRTKANLIVLSGCQSALGRQSPDAVISPAYGFTFAGTPNIISTLWSVEDHSSSMIFDYFYSYLADGIGSIEALSQAKRSFIDNAPKPSRHPFYWAPSIYYGKEVYYHRSTPTWYYVVSAFMLLFAAIFIYGKKNDL